MAQEITLKANKNQKNDFSDGAGFTDQIQDLSANHRCQQ